MPASHFATTLTAVFGKRPPKTVVNPTEADVRELFADFGREGALRLELADESESTTMTVFAENDAFHFTISDQETDYFSFLNEEAEEGEAEIAGHIFDERNVCRDRAVAEQIAIEFLKTGKPLASVQWTAESVEE